MRTLTIELDDEAADRLSRLVETGRFGDESQVGVGALASLEGNDTEMEDWLRNEVGPSCDAWKADPTQMLSFEEIRAKFEGEHQLSDSP